MRLRPPSIVPTLLLAFAVLVWTSWVWADPVSADQGPWERTETREDCSSFDPLREPFFGDTHVHTALSADAVINGTMNLPSDA